MAGPALLKRAASRCFQFWHAICGTSVSGIFKRSRLSGRNRIYTSALVNLNRHSFVMLMNSVSSILTLVTVLIHSVLGCCWHHEHACDFGHDHGQAVAVHTHDIDDHDHHDGHHHHGHHQDGDDQPAPDDDHSGHDGCEDGSCIVVFGPRVDLKAQLDATMCLPVPSSATLLVVVTQSQDGGVPCESPPWRVGSAPLYALTQVWLV